MILSSPLSEHPTPPRVGLLFDPPPGTWGLRGDPGFWAEMRDHLAAHPLPPESGTLSAMIADSFAALTGVALSDASDALPVPRLDQGRGGLSAGLVSGPFWRDTAVPLLLSRHAQALRS